MYNLRSLSQVMNEDIVCLTGGRTLIPQHIRRNLIRMLIGIRGKRLGKKGSKGFWRILIMYATFHIIKPDCRVLERRTHRIQEDTHRHPLPVPNPEGLFHQIRIQP